VRPPARQAARRTTQRRGADQAEPHETGGKGAAAEARKPSLNRPRQHRRHQPLVCSRRCWRLRSVSHLLAEHHQLLQGEQATAALHQLSQALRAAPDRPSARDHENALEPAGGPQEGGLLHAIGRPSLKPLQERADSLYKAPFAFSSSRWEAGSSLVVASVQMQASGIPRPMGGGEGWQGSGEGAQARWSSGVLRRCRRPLKPLRQGKSRSCSTFNAFAGGVSGCKRRTWDVFHELAGHLL